MLKFKKMGSDKVPLLLVTANVGSIFEDPSVMLPIWTSEFLQAVSRMDPKFIALHLQEVGGKAYEKSMQYVKDFVQRLCDCPELRLYDKIRIFLDEDFSSPEKFTALGNMYFAHSSLTDLKIWDFELKAYVEAAGKEIHSGNIEKRALRHTLRHLHSDVNAAPYFIFGDFNFRTDTGGVVKLQRFDRELEALRPHLYEFPVKFPPTYPFEEDVQLPTHYMKTRVSDSDGSPARRKLVRNQSEGSPKPSDVSSELRRLPIYLRVLLQSDRGTLQCCEPLLPCALCASFPSTLSLLRPRLSRLPTDPDLYIKKKLDTSTNVENTDAKRTRAGSLNELLHIPDVEITSADSSYDGIFVNDVDTTLLTVRHCVDPYTPESIDSHTPNMDAASSGSDVSNEIADVMGSVKIDIPSYKLTRDRSVSPTQLKSRLDRLLNDEKLAKVPELQRLNSRDSCKSDVSRKAGLCCLALKCYGFCTKRARKVECKCRSLSCCTC
ncbi:hypothetical protein MSG28_014294 [Choristoneura fumiferana]|uniref:Uncharacterized protein n=1 Tax=Choristoneura fumiferana TaxID=7141 RepID=A0ACC0JGP5_CHOFU|nr:hypothetical protein MSG28_014294 [Choristoneura fumiferana]